MKAYVINLPRSTERRRHLESELARTQLEHEFVDAVDGRLLTPELRRGRVDEDAVGRAPDWLRPGIVGAALSHLKAYSAILRDNARCGLVLEDDVVLSSDPLPLLHAVAEAVRGNELALLYYRGVRPMRLTDHDAVDLVHGHRLLYPLDEGVTAGNGYVITRRACEGMLERAVPVRAGPDNWDFFRKIGALETVRCVYPRPFGARADFKSAVDYLGADESLVQRVMTNVANRRIFPLHQLATLRRRRAERRFSQFAVVSDPPA